MKRCLEKKFTKKGATKYVTKDTFQLQFGFDAPNFKSNALKYIPINTKGKVINREAIINQN